VKSKKKFTNNTNQNVLNPLYPQKNNTNNATLLRRGLPRDKAFYNKNIGNNNNLSLEKESSNTSLIKSNENPKSGSTGKNNSSITNSTGKNK
jgi:hypothetical protein